MEVIGFTGGGHCGPDHGDALRKAGAGRVVPSMADLRPLLCGRSDVSRGNRFA